MFNLRTKIGPYEGIDTHYNFAYHLESVFIDLIKLMRMALS